MLSGPYQHFRNAIVSSWRGRVAGILTSRNGFRGGPLLDYDGTRQFLFSSHLRERDKMLLRSILCGGAWNGFLLGKTREEEVPCRFCGGVDGDGHLSGSALPPLLFKVGIILNSSLSSSLTAAPGPAVLPGMDGYLLFHHAGYSLPGLSPK